MTPNKVTTGILHAALTFIFLTMGNPAHSTGESIAGDGSPGSLSAAENNAAETASAGDCCSCRVAESTALQPPPMLPCTFDYPTGWEARFGDDGLLISAVVGAQCGAACGVSPGHSFSVSTGPDPNAEMREEIWSGMMEVVGEATCGDRKVTFFQSSGSGPNEQLGSLRFHIGAGGEAYSAIATFTCPVAGEWQQLRDLFIGSFRTNPESTFGQD